MVSDAVRTHHLTRSFGDVTAVDAVDIAVPEGSIFGLLGPDGAGKSTLLRMIATVLIPDAGDADVFGTSVTASPGEVTANIGYMSQQFAMYPDLTVAENTDFFATLRGVDPQTRRSRASALLDAMGLAEFTRRRAGRLSGGMKQKLMLASTLMHEPRLLLLDEPTTGVDPLSRREFWDILSRLRDDGKTIVVATPYMDEAERCTDVAFLDAGRVRHAGTPAEIKALLPGVLIEVATPDARAALALCRTLPGVASAHLLGEVVRLLWIGANPDELATQLAAVGIAATLEVRAPDMEAAFAHLAEAS